MHTFQICFGNVRVFRITHLLVRSYSFAKVSQQVVCVAEVAIGSTLSGAIPELLHYCQVCPENMAKQALYH